MRVWSPRTAFVMGAGQIGLLATLILRLRGLDVYTFARGAAPNLKSDIVTGMEATYVSTSERSVEEVVKEVGKADLIVDATGSSHVAMGSMQYLGLNGVLVWTSITGGEHSTSLESDRINLEWVLGNKLLLGSVNANRGHFESGIRDLALGEVMYPGVLCRILTHPVDGLENFQQMLEQLDRTENKATNHIRRLLLSHPPGKLGEDAAARLSFISKRTLARRLDAENSSFRALREEILANLAVDYLRDTDLTVEAIAAILNYHDSSSFRRAFKRWHNVTPQQFRQSQDKSRTSDTR